MMKKIYEVSFPAHCTNEQSEMMHDAVHWFLGKYNMKANDRSDTLTTTIETIKITLNACNYKDIDCWGQCAEWDNPKSDVDYVIDIAIDQSIRDMLATVFHECVHLWQWERGHWKGEGERETEQLQYELADEYWRCGNV